MLYFLCVRCRVTVVGSPSMVTLSDTTESPPAVSNTYNEAIHTYHDTAICLTVIGMCQRVIRTTVVVPATTFTIDRVAVPSNICGQIGVIAPESCSLGRKVL